VPESKLRRKARVHTTEQPSFERKTAVVKVGRTILD